MRTKLLVVMLAAVLASAGCATREQTPGWVHGEAAGYPASAYLLGRGQADTQAIARDRARADLAKNFEVHISEISHDRSSYGREGATSASSAQVSRELNTRIERVLGGVEIAGLWHDRSTGSHHALAILPRAGAAQALRQEMGSLDEATEAYLGRAQATDLLFARLRFAHHALLAQQQRAELQRSLRVLDVTGQGLAPRWNLGRMEADYHELLMRISIRPESSGHYSRELRDVLAGALSHAGFTVTGAAEFTVLARLDVEELAPRDGWHWRNGVLEVALRDGRGQSVGSQRWLLKESATDARLAERRVMERAGQVLNAEIATFLMGFAE
jgi:hypothetical protein